MWRTIGFKQRVTANYNLLFNRMKSAFIAGLVAFANAGRVHEFFAETNLICNMCQEVMEHANTNNFTAIDEIYTLFPKLQEKMNAFEGSNDLIDFSQPKKSCQNLSLCEHETIEELLMDDMPIDLSQIVEKINSNPNSSWKATNQARFSNMSRKKIMKMMGTVVDPDWVVRAPAVKKADANLAIPTGFDTSVQWPQCSSLVLFSRDQSDCGSCWAHGTTEAFNDRLCIATNGSYTNYLSTADTAGCCNGTACLSFDCNGGQVATPWRWFKTTGVVSGGPYGDMSLCYAYTMPECAHHVDSATLPPCDQVPTVAPGCYDTCQSNTSIVYSTNKQKTVSNYGFGGDVAAIQQDIMTYGTVSAAFTVYEDFLTYTSGVYYHQTGASLGGHAIKIYGWGYDAVSGMNYWICMNSWNNTWGMQGAFWIEMGNCGINNEVNAGHVF